MALCSASPGNLLGLLRLQQPTVPSEFALSGVPRASGNEAVSQTPPCPGGEIECMRIRTEIVVVATAKNDHGGRTPGESTPVLSWAD